MEFIGIAPVEVTHIYFISYMNLCITANSQFAQNHCYINVKAVYKGLTAVKRPQA